MRNRTTYALGIGGGFVILAIGAFFGTDAGVILPLLGKLALALTAAWVLGLQRQRAGKPVSARDAILVVSAGFVTVIVGLAFKGGDPSRIAAYGVAALGLAGYAGSVVLHRNGEREGLTTALGQVNVFLLGVAFALGLFALGAIITGLCFTVLAIGRSAPESECPTGRLEPPSPNGSPILAPTLPAVAKQPPSPGSQTTAPGSQTTSPASPRTSPRSASGAGQAPLRRVHLESAPLAHVPTSQLPRLEPAAPFSACADIPTRPRPVGAHQAAAPQTALGQRGSEAVGPSVGQRRIGMLRRLREELRHQVSDLASIGLLIAWFGFALSLVPTVLGTDKPAFSTAVITAVLNVVVLWATIRLKHYLPALANVAATVLWWIVAFQAGIAQHVVALPLGR